MDDGCHGVMVGLHLPQHFVLVVGGVDRCVQYQPHDQDGDECDRCHHGAGGQQSLALHHQKAAHGAGAEQGECQQVHRGYHGVELAADDRGWNIELEQVMRQPEKIHEEGQRDLCLGKIGRYAHCEKA